MAHPHPPHLAETRARFLAKVERKNNRLVAVAAPVHHVKRRTYDNELGIPADVTGIRAGAEVDVRIHRIIRDEAVGSKLSPRGAALLLSLAETPRPGWRIDGSENVDKYRRDQERGS